MQRKHGQLDAVKLEEGNPSANPNYTDEDLWRKRGGPPPRQGWSPVIVLLVGALVLSLCFAAFKHSEASQKAMTVHELAATLQAKTTEYAQKMATYKHRLDELEAGKRSADDAGKDNKRELEKLQEELTRVRHSLHEEQTKAIRIQRDNQDLLRKLKTKSTELKVLEDQTRSFEKEMNQLTKTIHTLQGDVQQHTESSDYQALYKRQEEQQQRLKDKQDKTDQEASNGKAKLVEHRKAGGRLKQRAAVEVVEAKSTDQAVNEGFAGSQHEYIDKQDD